MTNYYVASTGSDSNDGSVGSPWLTIQYAISQVSNGSTIYVVDSITTTTTITINKEITLTTSGSGSITKTTGGTLLLVQSSNVTISNLNLTQTTSNLADYLINIDRGSSGEVPPVNYSNCTIEGCTLNMWKYGISLNGSNHIVTLCDFLRQSGTTERLTCIVIYYINGASITACTVTDTLRMQRFIYLTSAGTAGSPYLNEVNSKTGLITASEITCSCSSAVQGLQFIIQDSFIGTDLSYVVANNQLNDSAIATKMFIAYVSAGSDLEALSNVSVYNNYQSLTATGAIIIDSPVAVTIDPAIQIFNSYDNTGNFVLRPDYSGNINFTQNSAVVGPPDLADSGIVAYVPYAGGDPHIIDIFGVKTTLPNDWYRFILYKNSTITVIAKAEFIGNFLLNHQLHYMIDDSIREIDIYNDIWVTNYTYMTEIEIIKNNRRLVFDTITGFVKYDDSSIIYHKSNVPVLSTTFGIKYPPKNLVAFDIDLEQDVMVISVDNYWDDINSIRLFTHGCINNKDGTLRISGELVKHSEDNRLE